MNLQAKFHPTVAQNLFKIKKHFPDAVIAGGAVRDLCLGRSIKDIDIFIPGTPNNAITVKRMTDRRHWIYNMDSFWQSVMYDNNWNARERKGYVKDDPKVDIIINLFKVSSSYMHPSIDIIFLITSVNDYINTRFDFNICKASFDGKKFSYSADFIKDSRNKTITLCGPKDFGSINYSLKSHLPRIKSKYPTFSMVIPEEYKRIIHNTTNF